MELSFSKERSYEGENNVCVLTATVDQAYRGSGYHIQIHFISPSGSPYFSGDINNAAHDWNASAGTATYPIPYVVMDKEGVLHAQLVATNTNGTVVAKSELYRYYVDRSVEGGIYTELHDGEGDPLSIGEIKRKLYEYVDAHLVDDTLTMSGWAGDAKVVGDILFDDRGDSHLAFTVPAMFTGTLGDDATLFDLPKNTWTRIQGDNLIAILSNTDTTSTGDSAIIWENELQTSYTYIIERKYSGDNRLSAWMIRSLGGAILYAGRNLIATPNAIGWTNYRTDADLLKSGRASDAKAVGDILYGANDHTGRTPCVNVHYLPSLQDGETFDIINMPKDSHIYLARDKLSNIPATITDTDNEYIYVVRMSMTSSGNISMFYAHSITSDRMFLCDYYREGTQSVSWREITQTSRGKNYAGAESIDELVSSGVYFSDLNSSGEKTLPGFPYLAGWLIVLAVPSPSVKSLVVKQIAIPHSMNGDIQIRMRSGRRNSDETYTWGAWMTSAEEDDTEDFLYTDFDIEPDLHWWGLTGTHHESIGQITTPIPVTPGQQLYGMWFGGDPPQQCGGAYLGADKHWISPIVFPFRDSPKTPNVVEYEYEHPDVEKNGTGLRYAKLWQIEVPQDAAYVSLNLRAGSTSPYRHCLSLSTLPIIGATETGNRIWKKGDAQRATKRDKVLYLIGPSTISINRSYRPIYDAPSYTDPNEKYPAVDPSTLTYEPIVGFQEYIVPYYKSVVSLGFDGQGYMSGKTTVSGEETDVPGIVQKIMDGDYLHADEHPLDDADEVIIMPNSNSTGGNSVIGDATDDSMYTYCGAINNLIKYIREKNNGHAVRIYLMTQWIRDPVGDAAKKRNAAAREIAGLSGSALIETDTIGVNYTNYRFLSYDANRDIYNPYGGHPNNEGNRLRGSVILNALLSNGNSYDPELREVITGHTETLEEHTETIETLADLVGISVKNVGVLSDNSDLNDLLSNNLPYILSPNSIWALRGDYNYSNAPDKPAYVLTMRLNLSGSDGGYQVLFGKNGRVYTRFKTSGVWGDWNGGIDQSLIISHSAADAKVVGDLLYGGGDHTDKTPQVISFWAHPEAFAIAKATGEEPVMPANTRTFCTASQVSDTLPDIVDDRDTLIIEKYGVNRLNTVCTVTVTIYTSGKGHVFTTTCTTTGGTTVLGAWREITNKQIVDDTLKKSGWAADAKVVGGTFDDLRARGMIRKSISYADADAEHDHSWADLNDLIEPGFYYVTPSNHTYDNAPSQNIGVLSVYASGASLVRQSFADRVGLTYEREGTITVETESTVKKTWGEWHEPTSSLDMALRSITFNKVDETHEKKWADLNDISEIGFYFITPTIHNYDHAPSKNAGLLTVYWNGASYIRQSFFDRITGIEYSRFGLKSGSDISWDPWLLRQISPTTLTIDKDSKKNFFGQDDHFDDFDKAPLNTIFRINANAKMMHSPLGNGISTANADYSVDEDEDEEEDEEEEAKEPKEEKSVIRNVMGYLDGTLMTYGSVGAYKHQIFISGIASGPSTGNLPPDDAILFFRTFYANKWGWGAWRSVSDRISTSSANIAIRKKFIVPYMDVPTEVVVGGEPRIVTHPTAVLRLKMDGDNPIVVDGVYQPDGLAGNGENYVIRAVNDKMLPIEIGERVARDWVGPRGEGPAEITYPDGVPTPTRNEQYIHGDPLYFNDFGDAPNHTIYQIDLDCDATAMAGNPASGVSSILITTGFARNSEHGKIQMCVGIDTSTPSPRKTFAFIRYGYIQSTNPYVYGWTTWTKMGDADKISDLEARISELESRLTALGG